jgi:hypothetical protein
MPFEIYFDTFTTSFDLVEAERISESTFGERFLSDMRCPLLAIRN